jgi:hypothetical protein
MPSYEDIAVLIREKKITNFKIVTWRAPNVLAEFTDVTGCVHRAEVYYHQLRNEILPPRVLPEPSVLTLHGNKVKYIFDDVRKVVTCPETHGPYDNQDVNALLGTVTDFDSQYEVTKFINFVMKGKAGFSDARDCRDNVLEPGIMRIWRQENYLCILAATNSSYAVLYQGSHVCVVGCTAHKSTFVCTEKFLHEADHEELVTYPSSSSLLDLSLADTLKLLRETIPQYLK